MDVMNTTFKYVAVRDGLRDRIRDLPVGTMLPSEAQLCAEYGVSRITLRKAVDYLAEEGLLVREQGRGTYTAAPNLAFKYRESFVDQISGFHTDMTRRGFTVGTQVLSQKLEPASPNVARELDLSPATMVVAIRRLRTVDGVINHLVHTFLPGKRFAGLTEIDLGSSSLYEEIRARFPVSFARSRFMVEVDAADQNASELLHVEPGSPLLVVHSTVMDHDGAPILFGTSWLLPEASQVEFEFTARDEFRGAATEVRQ